VPAAADVLLIIEVADTTLAYDRDVKIPIYARNAIAEVWLFEIQGGSLLVHRDPGPRGYQRVLTLTQKETLAPLLVPTVSIDLAEIWR
jgi:Uma2 family endonuclease